MAPRQEKEPWQHTWSRQSQRPSQATIGKTGWNISYYTTASYRIIIYVYVFIYSIYMYIYIYIYIYIYLIIGHHDPLGSYRRASHVSLLRFSHGTKAWQGQSMPWPRLTIHIRWICHVPSTPCRKKTKHILFIIWCMIWRWCMIYHHIFIWNIIWWSYDVSAFKPDVWFDDISHAVPCPCGHLTDSEPSKTPTAVRDSHGVGRPGSKQTYWASLTSLLVLLRTFFNVD